MKIPVLIEFDQNNQIGWLDLDETKLPKYSDYVFTLGYMPLKFGPDGVDEVDKIVCVSLSTDVQYVNYLRKIGKLSESSSS
jgi:hypothetical protein